MSTGSKRKLFTAAALLGALSMPVVAHAQAQGGGGGQGNGGGGGGGGGGRGRFDPAQMKQRMMDSMKDQLGTSDDEFAAMQPKIEKVMDAQRAVNSGGSIRALFVRGGGGGGGQGGGGGGGGGQGGRRGGGGGGGPGGMMTDQNSAVYKATQDLTTTLEDKDAKPEDVKAKLEAYRAAKTAAKADLTKAQDDLKSVLTAKQEAALVEDGLLD